MTEATKEFTFKDAMLLAPEEQLDRAAMAYIENWDNPPTSLQILEVLDLCARYAWASQFTMVALETFLKVTMERENTTYEAVVAQASWRKNTDA